MWVQRRVPLIEPLIFLAILWAPDLAGEAAVLAAEEAKAVGQGQPAGKLLLLAGQWGRGLMSVFVATEHPKSERTCGFLLTIGCPKIPCLIIIVPIEKLAILRL